MTVSGKARAVLTGASSLFLIVWPLLILAAVRFERLDAVLVLTAVVFALRLARTLIDTGAAAADKRRSAFLSVGGLTLTALALVFDRTVWVLWYPVLVNAAFFVYFSASLIKGPPVVERLARLAQRGKPLPDEAIPYTRRVTQAWCVFFVANGSIAAATVMHGDLQIWTLWNGCLSYVAIGVMMAVEWLIRKWIQHD